MKDLFWTPKKEPKGGVKRGAKAEKDDFAPLLSNSIANDKK